MWQVLQFTPGFNSYCSALVLLILCTIQTEGSPHIMSSDPRIFKQVVWPFSVLWRGCGLGTRVIQCMLIFTCISTTCFKVLSVQQFSWFRNDSSWPTWNTNFFTFFCKFVAYSAWFSVGGNKKELVEQGTWHTHPSAGSTSATFETCSGASLAIRTLGESLSWANVRMCWKPRSTFNQLIMILIASTSTYCI